MPEKNQSFNLLKSGDFCRRINLSTFWDTFVNVLFLPSAFSFALLQKWIIFFSARFARRFLSMGIAFFFGALRAPFLSMGIAFSKSPRAHTHADANMNISCGHPYYYQFCSKM
jgi:uncharacterized membrane protein required for colicin V production